MEFKTKEDYLLWRSEWRAEYRQLSVNIRDLKWAHKHRLRSVNPNAGSAVKQRAEVDTPRYEAIRQRLGVTAPHWFPTGLLFKAQQRAREMMSARDDSKLAAERCYQAWLATQTPLVKA